MASHAVAGIPRRLDPQRAAKVSTLTLDRYRAAARPFVGWCYLESIEPTTAAEWDDTLLEFKAAVSLPKAKFEYLVAAVEFFSSRLKGHLATCRMAL